MISEASTSPGRILVVEDQDDVRRLLVTALTLEGHDVDDARNATEGLRRMHQSTYHLVVTDFAMPGGTGAWMIREATRRGLMPRTVAVIVTAHPDVHKVSNVQVFVKPFDLDQFLEQVRRLLVTEHPERRRRPRVDPRSERPRDDQVDLVLYVNSASSASMQAVSNVDALLRRLDAAEVRLTVRDLALDPAAGDEDGIGVTPTLVKRHPEPRMWVLGNLRDPEVLEDLLRLCGVTSRH